MTKTARTFGTNNYATTIIYTAFCERINAFMIEPNRLDLTRTWEWTLGHTLNAFSIVQWRKIVTICCLRQKYFRRSIENRFSRKTRHFLLHSIGTELIFRAKQLNTDFLRRYWTMDNLRRAKKKKRATHSLYLSRWQKNTKMSMWSFHPFLFVELKSERQRKWLLNQINFIKCVPFFVRFAYSQSFSCDSVSVSCVVALLLSRSIIPNRPCQRCTVLSHTVQMRICSLLLCPSVCLSARLPQQWALEFCKIDQRTRASTTLFGLMDTSLWHTIWASAVNRQQNVGYERWTVSVQTTRRVLGWE